MNIKIAVAVSPGGHLTEAQKILSSDVIGNNEIIILTEKTSRTESLKEKVYFIGPLNYNPFPYIPALLKCLTIFKKEKIRAIITTGAEVALPACIAGKLLGIKTIFIETITHPKTTTLAGKICYYFSDIFLVQCTGMERYYGQKARYMGGIV